MWHEFAPVTLSNTILKPHDQVIDYLYEGQDDKPELDDDLVEHIYYTLHDILGERKVIKEPEWFKEFVAKQTRDELKAKLESLENGLEYKTWNDNNLHDYLTNLLWYDAFLHTIESDIVERNRERFKEINYVVAIRMRFVRCMVTLNNYSDGKFHEMYPRAIRADASYKRYIKLLTSYDDEERYDEFFWKRVKRDNIMKLARNQVNRYITIKNDGIYTSILVDKDKAKEMIKFAPKGARQLPEKIWNSAGDTPIEGRVKTSCENFEQLSETEVISTYQKYYVVDNHLEIRSDVDEPRVKRLYLEYVINPEDKLEVPFSKKGHRTFKTILHTLPGQESEKVCDTMSKDYPYAIIDQKPFRSNPAAGTALVDMFGLNYAIRNNIIAVEPPTDFFHSMLWSGKKVQCAGLLCAWNGKLLAVDNASGHYQPNWYLLYKAWSYFFENERNIFYPNAIIGVRMGVLVPDSMGGANFNGVLNWYNQFFPVTFFMKLAGDEFPLLDTVKILDKQVDQWPEECTESEGTGRRPRKRKIDQSYSQKCESVKLAANLKHFRQRIWSNKDRAADLACSFLDHLNYDWKELDEKLKRQRKHFRPLPFTKRNNKIERIVQGRNNAKLEEQFQSHLEKMKNASDLYKGKFPYPDIFHKTTYLGKLFSIEASLEKISNDSSSNSDKKKKFKQLYDNEIKTLEPLRTENDKKEGSSSETVNEDNAYPVIKMLVMRGKFQTVKMLYGFILVNRSFISRFMEKNSEVLNAAKDVDYIKVNQWFRGLEEVLGSPRADKLAGLNL